MRVLLFLFLFITTAQAQISDIGRVYTDGMGSIVPPCPVREVSKSRRWIGDAHNVVVICQDWRKFDWNINGNPDITRMEREAAAFKNLRAPDAFQKPPNYQEDRFASDIFALFFYFIVIPGSLLAAAIYGWGFINNLPQKTQKAIWETNLQRSEQAAQAREQAKRDDLRTVPAYPTPLEFKTALATEYVARSETHYLVTPYLSELLEIITAIYERDFRKPRTLPSLQDPFEPYDLFFKAMLDGLLAFTKAVPPLNEPKGYKLAEDAMYTEEVVQIDPLAFKALAEPIRSLNRKLPDIFNWSEMNYLRGEEGPTRETSYDEKEDKQLKKEYEKKSKEFEKYREKMEELTTPTQWAVHGTPFFTHYLPLGCTVKKPFEIPDTPRFEGMWMVAPSGSGKTNALLKLITDDFDRVAKGEASVVVMDSSGMAPGRLLHFLSRHQDFAPGGRLENRLVVLDPSFDYPLALNLFDVDIDHINSLSSDQRAAALGAARDMIRFVLGSLLGSELTQKQSGLFRYLTEAMMFIPNATIFTLAELLEDAGYEKHREHILKLDDWAVKFFEQRFRQQYKFTRPLKNAFVSTKSELFWRIDSMLSEQLFRGMFSHAKNKLDMFKEMQSGKVILINTNRELLREDGMETFGRFMLAFIYRAAEKRLSYARKENIPVFVYLDECHDYIASEPRVVKLLDQLARKNNIGFAFAHQRPNNIKSAEVLDALSSTAIRFASRNEHGVSYVAERLRVDPPELITQLNQGVFAALVREPKGTRTGFVTFPLVEDKISLMTDAEYAAIQKKMRADYSRPPEEAPELKPPPAPQEDDELAETIDGDQGDWFDGPKT